MTDHDRWEDALPDLAAGRLDAGRAADVRAHLDRCARCREELDLLRRLATTAVAPPPELEARIRVAAREAVPAGQAGEFRLPRGRRPWSPWRPLAVPLAAAAGIVALWFAIPALPGSDPDPVPAEVTGTVEVPVYDVWPAAGVEVAGAPVLSDLSDEALETLLEEMEP